MEKTALLLLIAFAVGPISGCGTLVNLAAPASVWDDGEPRMILGGSRADLAAIEKCFARTEEESADSHKLAVLVGCGLILDVPVSTAADICGLGALLALKALPYLHPR
jgi:hypothetical protein